MICQYQPVEPGRLAGRAMPGDLQGEGIQQDRTLELGLFHHFTMETYKALARDNSQDGDFLQRGIPKLALSHEFLLDTILALSALHLEHLGKDKSKSWMRTALHYHDRALLAFNKALAHITPQNCEAVTVCSMLMIVLVIAIPGVADGGEYSNPVGEILGLRNCLHGVRLIATQSVEIISTGELGSFFMPSPDPVGSEVNGNEPLAFVPHSTPNPLSL